MKESNLLVIISGVSGVGKSEVMKRLLTYPELNSQKLITTTTRLPREGEINNHDYFFVSQEKFIKDIKNNQFLEYVEYNNNYYGTSLNSLKKGLLTKNVFLTVDVRGFQKIKKIWDSKIVSFWLQPPNHNKLLSNLRKRGEKEEEIKKRLTIAEREIPFAKEYDFILTVNDNLDQVAAEIKRKFSFWFNQFIFFYSLPPSCSSNNKYDNY